MLKFFHYLPRYWTKGVIFVCGDGYKSCSRLLLHRWNKHFLSLHLFQLIVFHLFLSILQVTTEVRPFGKVSEFKFQYQPKPRIDHFYFMSISLVESLNLVKEIHASIFVYI